MQKTGRSILYLMVNTISRKTKMSPTPLGPVAFDSAYHHFVLYGDQEGRAASRFFDTAAYREEQGLGSDESALEHFLLVGLPQGVSAPTTADFTSEGLA
jgi:hypothetical protein